MVPVLENADTHCYVCMGIDDYQVSFDSPISVDSAIAEQVVLAEDARDKSKSRDGEV